MSDPNEHGKICEVPVHLLLFGPDYPETDETRMICERYLKSRTNSIHIPADICNLADLEHTDHLPVSLNVRIIKVLERIVSNEETSIESAQDADTMREAENILAELKN